MPPLFDRGLRTWPQPTRFTDSSLVPGRPRSQRPAPTLFFVFFSPWRGTALPSPPPPPPVVGEKFLGQSDRAGAVGVCAHAETERSKRAPCRRPSTCCDNDDSELHYKQDRECSRGGARQVAVPPVSAGPAVYADEGLLAWRERKRGEGGGKGQREGQRRERGRAVSNCLGPWEEVGEARQDRTLPSPMQPRDRETGGTGRRGLACSSRVH